MRPLFTFLFGVVLLLPSCASTRTNPLLSQVNDGELSKKEFKTLSKKSAKLWQIRNEPGALEEFLSIEQKIANSKQSEQNDFVLLSRAEYLLGEFFTEDDHGKTLHFERASNWAEKALTFNARFKDALLRQKLPTELALDVLEKKDSEGLYWLAVSLGKWASRKGISTSLKYKDRIKKMVDRVAILNPHYLFSAVNRYYGAFYASLPGFNEEELRLSRSYFEKAIKLGPDYFSNHVLFAEYYAKKVDDQALFRKHLEVVVKGNPHHLKDFYPEQILEQIRAKKLLEGTKQP